MNKRSEARRDRAINRAIHRLFWRCNFVDVPLLIISYLTRTPAQILYHILIPVQIAFAVQALFDRQFDQITGYAVSIVLLAVGFCVLWAIGGLTISKEGMKSVLHLERTIFSNFLRKDYEFYSNTYVGALGAQVSRMSDALANYNLLFTRDFPRLIVIVLGGIIAISVASPLLAFVTFISMTFVLSFTLLSTKWRVKFRRAISESTSEIAGVVGDALSHGATVKSFAAENTEDKRLMQFTKNWGEAMYKSWISSIPADVGRTFLAALATAGLLVVTSLLYKDGSITVAVVALVQLYVIKMIAATQDIADSLKLYETVMGSAYQPMKTMMITPTVVDTATPKALPANKNLSVRFNATYRYHDAVQTAVRAFDLTIEPGEKIGLVGYSGSGKTTLTKLLLRFMDVTEGAICLGDVDLRDITQEELRNRIAYVPQEPVLFHRSVAENIAYGKPGANKKAMHAAAAAAYVDEFVKDLPNGYDTLVGERGVKLSGGQRQRVAIARALLRDAPILVLDEATSALDSRSEKLIQDALWKLMKDRTALVIAHRLSTIQRMDRIVVMDKGKIVQIGTHQELIKKKSGIYAELWAHQSGGYMGVTPNVGEIEA